MNGTVTNKSKGIASTKLSLIVVATISLQSLIASAANAQASMQDNLPPEVIPTSAAVANQLVQAQQQQAAAAPGLYAQSTNVPGLVSPSAVNSGTAGLMGQFQGANAKEIKQNFYNSLMGQANAPALANQMNQPNAMAQMSQMNPASLPASINQPNSQMPGSQSLSQSNWNNPQQMASAAQPPQSQTLYGNVGDQQQQQGLRKGAGLSHAIGLFSSVGMGAFASAMRAGTNPTSLYTTGLSGASFINYGMNNGFRY